MLRELLVKRTLTTATRGGRGSTYDVSLTQQQCEDMRDGLAKAIYQGLFDWLVGRLNETMAAEAEAGAAEAKKRGGGGGGGEGEGEAGIFIGLLDVFGFENFELNSFEQLCINYANEKLQKHFIDAVGRLQHEDYVREGISTAALVFPDNSAQILLIDGRMGVLSLLDEECALPKGSEAN